MAVKTLTEQVTRHHRDCFGNVEMSRITTKLAEEVGELCSAVIRDYERRDDRQWDDDIKRELGDCLIVLHAIAGRLDMDLCKIQATAVERFLGRTWKIRKG